MQQQIIDSLAQRLSVTMSYYFNSVSPVLTPLLQYYPYKVEIQNPISLGGIDAIDGAIMSNPSADLIASFVEMTEHALKHYIHEAYFKMVSNKIGECNETDVYKKVTIHLKKTIQPSIPLIIISNGVDLHELQTIYPDHFYQIEGIWHVDKYPIYEFCYTTEQSKYDSSFFFINQNEAPFLDFNKVHEKIRTFIGTSITDDPYQSLEIYVGSKMKANGCPKNNLMVKPLIPLLYNPNANISALKVNIDYDNAVKVGLTNINI